MEEREALKSQIELLQNLINKHKSIHGDKPFTGSEPRPSGSSTSRPDPSVSTIYPHSSRRSAYAFQRGVSWTKTYSLKNKTPSASASTSSSSAHHQPVSHSVSLPSASRGKESGGSQTASSSSGIPQNLKDGHTKTRITGAAAIANKSVMSHHDIQHKPIAESRHVVQQGNEGIVSLIKASTSTSSQSGPQVKIKPSLSNKSNSTKQNYSVSAKASGPAPSALSIASTQPSFASSTHSRETQISSSFLKKSKFTWIKNQNMTGGNFTTSRTTSVPPASVSKATGSPSLLTPSKKASAKKSLRKLVPVSVTPKTSKYKWVSSAQLKSSRKSPSPKSLSPPQRPGEKGDATKKAKAAIAASPRQKKGSSGSSASAAPGSRYRWKASGVGESAGATGALIGNRRRSSFHWTADNNSRVFRGGLFLPPAASPQASVPSSSPSAFKLRSRMKIIRKSSNSHGGGGAEKGAAPSAGRSSPRARIHPVPRRPAGVRRTPSRELVAFGRHKLRRLSPSSSRTNPTSTLSHPGSAYQRVFTSRYKMVTRPGSTSTYVHHYNPALSWRAKKIQSARSFLQRRHRVPYNTHLSFSQYWRGTQMCWIDDSLYRVSANRLSRTAPASLSINRTGRSPGFQHSHLSPALLRASSTRNLASRAVQRSLAIIRHARQKKQPRQYCMYYNRFGKCNRGTSCPYIHDRDKVAVCTRFLRGTCKQADTCPFSHKVAKEKMPVCSYFLKGICNNSDCPYSHVYVSHKAEVCEDFVKGYCPEGEKCKKKHTLVCPDFSKSGSCPRGSRCKLQHRQRVKCSSSSFTPPAKKARREPVERPHLSVMIPEDSQAAQGTPKRSSLALPSYISLSSSPEEADAPDTLPVKEKNLQIKPRL
ncbi:zinc finger CCCH domain-containing protein 3 [Salarias fasciatus]|uniref:Zinc finger CCCH domain-containing protein 3 n=1 Tax=Salarias fasciatus TaxID=181472 RepID=A0A672ITM0_SALFA|nr:zinc finger CCCH domain-containing protein 3 [Salarias fasciatus]